MTSVPRRLLATALIIPIACAVVLAAPGPAAAAAGNITCVGTTRITYDPGLTFETRPVHATETTHLSPCTSTEPGINSGMNVEEYTAEWSCLSPLETSSATHYPIHWNNGTSSILSTNYTVSSVGPLAISAVHGSVVDGVLAGATVTGAWIYAQPNALQCLSGMQEQIALVELIITLPS